MDHHEEILDKWIKLLKKEIEAMRFPSEKDGEFVSPRRAGLYDGDASMMN